MSGSRRSIIEFTDLSPSFGQNCVGGHHSSDAFRDGLLVAACDWLADREYDPTVSWRDHPAYVRWGAATYIRRWKLYRRGVKKTVRRVHVDARVGAQGGDDSDFDGDQHPTGQTTGSVTIGPIAAEQEVDGMAQAGTDSGTLRSASNDNVCTWDGRSRYSGRSR